MVKMNLKKSLEGTTVCQLDRISDPNVKSKHVLIVVSGFNQEDENKTDYWTHLIAHYKYAEIFALSWTACTPTSFLSHGTFGKMAMLKQQESDQKKAKNKQNKKIFGNLINFYNTAKRQFVFAVD